MGQLTTHVLDISAGLPAGGVRIELHAREIEGLRLLASVATGPDGRLPAPLLSGAQFKTGSYLLKFHTAEYFRSRGVQLPQPAFIEQASIEIGIAADQHYHVPLLIAPWSYSVYRGG
ncbi:MAG TPA: hydroxyisourate hydrolase [Steroidobacteraceae bacterium]|jgi:5-hydroxyisourate hydrolase|nr:hydroxyisourate hydrolase [Steroidobacteraceae bacterium]